MHARDLLPPILGLLVILSLLHWKAVADTEEEEEDYDDDDECFECSTKVNTSIGLIRDMLTSREPLKIDKNVLPCTACNFTGIKSLEANKKVCPILGGPEDDPYYDHYLEMRFVEIVITCQCSLQCNPRTCSDAIVPKLEELRKEMEESQKAAPVEEDDPPISQQQEEYCSVKDCGGTESQGTLEAAWPNVLMGVTLRAWKNSGKIKTEQVDFLSRRSKATPRCGDAASPFYDPCKCLLDLNFPMLVFKEVMGGMFPKEDESANAKENEEMMNMLTCMDTL